MSDTTPAYVARCKHGQMVCATVDRPEYQRHTAKDVANWVRRGLTIERTTVEDARSQIDWCGECEQERNSSKTSQAASVHPAQESLA